MNRMERKTMSWRKSLFSLTALSLGMSLELATLKIKLAHAGVSNSISQKTWQVSQFNPPDRGVPTTSIGGASRGGLPICNEIAILSPKDANQNAINPKPYFGLTVATQPSFLFYTKGSQEYAGAEITFVLTDLNTEKRQDDEEIYETTFTLPETSGTFIINLPSDVILEEGKLYEWYMELTDRGCSSPSTEGNSVEAQDEAAWMNGFVERVAETPELKNDLVIAQTAIDRSEVYGDAGIWFDALNELAQERRTADTSELEASWKALLQYADIKDEMKDTILNADLIDCCSVESTSEESSLTTNN